MKNNRLLFCVIFVIAFAVFNVVVFQLPVNRTEIFWITYSFTCVAFAILFAVWHRCFFLDETPKSRFLGYGITYVATYYFVAQLALFVIVLGVPDIKKWLVIITNTLLLGLTMILVSFTQIGKNYINNTDKGIAEKVGFIKTQVSKLQLLSSDLPDGDVKNKLADLIEQIKYSDPNSSKNVEDIERKIAIKIGELKYAENMQTSINDIKQLFQQRNELCKLYK
ncbi:MAG: hypothetical protein KBS60_04640 [Phascolarctobacterium sp.]|nr:hypothetical protein [Candidatus Phascolarctobacterium caballi]